jgi:hypothetical protein
MQNSHEAKFEKICELIKALPSGKVINPNSTAIRANCCKRTVIRSLEELKDKGIVDIWTKGYKKGGLDCNPLYIKN